MIKIFSLEEAEKQLPFESNALVVVVKDSNKKSTKTYHAIESVLFNNTGLRFMFVECDDVWTQEHIRYGFKVPDFMEIKNLIRRFYQENSNTVIFVDTTGTARANACALIYGLCTNSLNEVKYVLQNRPYNSANPWILKLGCALLKQPKSYEYLCKEFPALDVFAPDPVDSTFFEEYYSRR